MKKIVLKALTLVLLALEVLLFLDLMTPIKESTYAINKEAEFRDVYEEEFFTDFHSPYQLALTIKKVNLKLEL